MKKFVIAVLMVIVIFVVLIYSYDYKKVRDDSIDVTLGIPDSTIKIGRSDIETPRAASTTHLHSIVADGLHLHGFDIDWRPAYVKFLEAKFN